MRTIVWVFGLLLLKSCQIPEKTPASYPIRENFKFPIYNIKYNADTAKATLWKVDSLMSHYPLVIRTKYAFQDTILDAELNHGNRLEITENFFSLRERISEFQEQETTENFFSLGDQISEFQEQETIDSDSLTILADYKQNIVTNAYDNRFCYPIYVINNQKKPKLFTGKDRHVFAIQEALHPNGKWYPIEQRGLDFCGNGHWSTTLNPKEYIVFFVPKYQGDFKTKLRVRLHTGEKALFSEPIIGYISMKQFLLSPVDKKRKLKNPSYIKGRFYSVLPFEFDSEIYQNQSTKSSGYTTYSSNSNK